MIEVLEIIKRPNKFRLAIVRIKYYDLIIICDLCIYKNENFWIRMPEYWREKDKKIQFVFWPDQKKSDEFQGIVLNKVISMLDLTLEKGIKMRKEAFVQKKLMTKKKKVTTLNEKNSER